MMRVLIHVWGVVSSGVPSDLVGLRNITTSVDFGLYSQCEMPRGSGQLSGICVPPSFFVTNDDIPFCGEFVTYASCVPPTSSVPAWSSWNSTAKDSLISDMFQNIVAARIAAEAASVANASLPYVDIRFTANTECVSNFKKALCMFNFPKCDYTGSVLLSDKTLDISQTVRSTFPICQSECVTYFSSCRFDSLTVAGLCASGSVWPMAATDLGALNGTSLLSSDQC